MLNAIALRQRTLARRALGLACLAASTACAGTTRIGTILDDPNEFDGREVRVQGEVTQALSIPLAGGTYEVDDGTGSLRVITDAGAPREGAEVTVVGTFRALFAVGAETLSVLQERERDVR